MDSEFILKKTFEENIEMLEFFSKKRDENVQLLIEARNQGRRDDELYHLFKCKKYEQLMKKADEQAADATFKINNQCCSFTEIDLHNLRIGEAIIKLNSRILEIVAYNTRAQTMDSDSENNYYDHCDPIIQELKVIVGQGWHSREGAKIKPAVEKYARKYNIDYEIDVPNPGSISFVNLNSLTPPRPFQSPHCLSSVSSHHPSHLQYFEPVPISFNMIM